MEEFYQEILKQGGAKKLPIQTYFIDSSPTIAPFMSSIKARDGFEFAKGLSFLGRSGVKVISGLRVGFLSGVDIDSLTSAQG